MDIRTNQCPVLLHNFQVSTFTAATYVHPRRWDYVIRTGITVGLSILRALHPIGIPTPLQRRKSSELGATMRVQTTNVLRANATFDNVVDKPASIK